MSTLVRFRRVIAEVPRGRVITYGEVAAAAGFPGAARLTVRALQWDDALPWHRVVAAGGRISLPGVSGREQRLRLRMEGVTFRGGRVRMELHAWRPRRRAQADRPRSRRRGRRIRRPRANSARVADDPAEFGPPRQPIRHAWIAEPSGRPDEG